MNDHVFICYSRKDENFVLKLAMNLKRQGVPVWLDQWDIPSGANWNRTIEKALNECTHLLLILSPPAVESDDVQCEWLSALDEKKVVVPILYQPCHMPFRLKPIQYIDFTSRSPDDEKSIEQVLRALGIAGSTVIEPLSQKEYVPEKASDWLKKGAALFLQNNCYEAIKAFDKAIEFNPQLELAWYGKGDACFSLNVYDEAIKAYDKAIELNPQCINAWNNKGLALFGQKKYDEAIKAFDKAIELNPQDAMVLYNKGLALMGLGKLEKAIKAYDKAIELNPQLAWVWNYKGDALMRQENYDEAIKAFDRAIEIDPQYADAWHKKSKALKLLDRTAEAKVAFTKAKELGYEG